MRAQSTIVIGPYTYELTQIGAIKGRVLVVKLLKIVGRVLPSLKGAIDKDGKIVASEIDLGIIQDLFDGFSEEELEPFWEAYCELAWVRTNTGRAQMRDVFDEHFAGRYADLAKFFAECTKFNFGDFLAEAKAVARVGDAP